MAAISAAKYAAAKAARQARKAAHRPQQREAQQAIRAAESTIAQAADIREAEARRQGAQRASGVRIPPRLAAQGGASGLAAFAAYGKGSPAPWWLFQGVCDAWGLNVFATEMRLITVSENVTYLLLRDGAPLGVVRVSQPGYVGGPVAVASEIAWIGALRQVEGVNVVENIPTASGFPVAPVKDEGGAEWSCVCMAYVEGAALEDLPDPSPYYRTLGSWAARFHNQARTWQPPRGFTRFTWGIDDMIGSNPRWGRWQDADLTPSERGLFLRAQHAALQVVRTLPRTRGTWGLVHADLRPSNIIAAPDGTLTVIDFDDCGYSWYLYDFAAALSFVEHKAYAPAMAKLWMEGYREVSLLTESDVYAACALSMVRRLQMLGWTTNHYADALPEGLYDEQIPGTVICAERYLDSPTWLLD